MNIAEYPALELVALLSAYPVTEEIRDRIHVALSRPVDWAEFLFWAKRHGVVGILLANAQALGREGFPDQAFSALKQAQHRFTSHAARLLSTLQPLQGLLAGQGLDVVLLKGPVFSLYLYGSFNMRLSYDIDLLVSQSDFPAADALLRQNGYACYEPARPLTPPQSRLHARYRHHYSYRHPQQGIAVELHWSLAEPYFASPQFSSACLRRARTTSLPGLQVKTLTPEDMLVYAFVHGAKHRWASLKYLLDLRGMLRISEGIDWQEVSTSILALGLQRVVAQGLFLLRALWDDSPPEALLPFAQPDPASRFLADFSLELLSWRTAEKRQDPRWFLYGLLLKPSIVYKAHYLSKILALPLLPPD